MQACALGAKRAGAVQRAQQAVDVLAPFVDCPLYKKLQSCKLLATEMPFVIPLPGQGVQTGIMDAVFEQSDGVLWIVDYKTDQVSAGQEAALFAQKYRSQLSAYKQAAEQIFPGKTIRASVIFVRTFAAIDL